MQHHNIIKSWLMTTFKEKSREELVAAFRRAIDRKKEWEKEAQKEFEEIRNRGLQLKL